jgi:hypothetical protein
MTETEWLTSPDPYKMLSFLPGKVSGRKLRLFACGCCRQRVWHLLTDKRFRETIEVAERYAEGTADQTLLRAAWTAAREAAQTVRGSPKVSARVARYAASASVLAAHRSHKCARETAGRVFSTVYYGVGLYNEPKSAEERAAHLVLVRCVFGNPFHRVTVNPVWLSWNGGTISKLAQNVYDKRRLPNGALDSARLHVLADALEEAGCIDQEMLTHCRGPGPHVRGCWVVDALLGKK